jgi:hypothetical protein
VALVPEPRWILAASNETSPSPRATTRTASSWPGPPGKPWGVAHVGLIARDWMSFWALYLYMALACSAGSVASLPTVVQKKNIRQGSARPTKKRLGGGWTRTTADNEPHQHFMPPPNHHLPERMSYAEFSRRFVDHNISIHDPASEDYKPFALLPPSIRPGSDPHEVFSWCARCSAYCSIHLPPAAID